MRGGKPGDASSTELPTGPSDPPEAQPAPSGLANKASDPLTAFFGFLLQALTLGAKKVRQDKFPQLIGAVTYIGLVAVFAIALSHYNPKALAAAIIMLALVAVTVLVSLTNWGSIGKLVVFIVIVLLFCVVGYGLAKIVTDPATLSSPDPGTVKAPAQIDTRSWKDVDEVGAKYVVTWSVDANCSEWEKKVAFGLESAAGRECNFTRPQVHIGESRDAFDHWDVAVNTPGKVYDVDCRLGLGELFEDQTSGQNGLEKGVPQGNWGRCRGYINGGDNNITISAYYKIYR